MELHGFRLDNLGCLVELKTAEEKKKTLPTILIVQDVSGSMGNLVSSVLSGALPSAMLEKGYNPNTDVHVITFASDAKILKVNGKIPTIRTLQNEFFQGDGFTNLAGVFELVKHRLSKCENVCMFAVSDGEIGDVQETLRIAKNYYDSSSARVDVTMIRLKTSHHSNPDTVALACLGQFSTIGEHNIFDVETAGKTNNELIEHLKLLFMQHISTDTATFEIEARNIRRSPSDVPLHKVIAQKSTVLLLPVECKELKIDGVSYPILMQETISKTCVVNFCDYVRSQLQLQNVIGNDVSVIKSWFTKLEASLNSSQMSSVSDHAMLSRVKQMTKQCSRLFKSQVQYVLECANQDKLKNLNAQQKADYLRQSNSMSLAKRMMKNKGQQSERGENETLQFQGDKILQTLRLMKDDLKTDNCEVSFYSVNNNQESYDCLLEENIDCFQLADLDILRLFGLLGVTYHHKPGDFVDPYIFHVKQVLAGGFLSLADLREANSTKLNGVQAELQAPGTHTNITGVIPLRFLNPRIFDIVWNHGMKILEAHASINMRRMLAPVRSDMLGERIGLLMNIMRNNSDLSQPISLRDREIFDDISYQLTALMNLDVNKIEFATFFNLLKTNTCIRNSLTGSLNISCIQKPMIALLQCANGMSQNYLRECLEVLFEFDAYHAARRAFQNREDRDLALIKLCAIQVEKMLEWFPLADLPYFAEECDGKYRFELLQNHILTVLKTRNWNLSPQVNLDDYKWMPKIAHFGGYHRFLSSNSNGSFEITSRKYTLALIAAIFADCEQDRIVEGKNQMFEWNDDKSEDQFVTSVIQKFYSDFYAKECILELQRRDHQALMTQIYLVTRENLDFEDFCNFLQEHIPNRQHAGYKLLVHEILKTEMIDSEKLAVLVAGRTLNNEVLFAQGNFDDQFWTYEKYFDHVDWQTLVQLRQEFGVYRYRISDLPNSHGHCNSNPSHWATHIYPTLRK